MYNDWVINEVVLVTLSNGVEGALSYVIPLTFLHFTSFLCYVQPIPKKIIRDITVYQRISTTIQPIALPVKFSQGLKNKLNEHLLLFDNLQSNKDGYAYRARWMVTDTSMHQDSPLVMEIKPHHEF